MPDGDDWIEYMLNIPANADHKEMGEQNHFSLGVKDADVAAAELKSEAGRNSMGPKSGATARTASMRTIPMARAWK